MTAAPPAAEVVPIRPPVTVGGSRAAAVAGVDPYRSPIMEWVYATGRAEQPESEAMTWGKLLEPVVYARVAESYELLPAPADGLADPERRWCVGHPDGFAVVDGERGVLEVKTSGPWAHGWNEDRVPLHYQAQAQHYLHLTNLDMCLFACLVAGQRLVIVELERDDAAIERLLDLEAEWLGYVERDELPPTNGSGSDRDAAKLLYPEAETGRRYRLTGAEWELLRELRSERELRDAHGDRADELENMLRLAMGDAEVAISPHDTEALRYPTVVSNRLNAARLKAERPDIHAAYVEPSTSRRFSLV